MGLQGEGVYNPPPGLYQPPISGKFYQGIAEWATANGLLGDSVNGAITAMPWYMPIGFSFQAVAINVSTAGAAGSLIRLGAYRDTGAVFPDFASGNGLLFDWGTVTSSATGVQTITTSGQLPTGWCWLVAALQGDPASAPKVYGPGSLILPINGLGADTAAPTLGGTTSNSTGYKQLGATSNVTGAFPTTIPGTLIAAGQTAVAMIILQAT